jgi:hypothetical protein
MTLPVSGAISFNAINVELGVAGTTQANINQASYRTLAGVPSGQISLSNFYGKSNRVTASATISANTTNYTLNTAKASGYVAGVTDMTLTINSGIFVSSSSTGTAAFIVDTSWTTGDTVTIVNNGTIVGRGGQGASNPGIVTSVAGNAGGTGLQVLRAASVNNVNRIAGGGGGGGGGGGASGSGGAAALGGNGGGGIGNGSAGGTGATAGTLTAVGSGQGTVDSVGTCTVGESVYQTIATRGASGAGGTYGTSGASGASGSWYEAGACGGSGYAGAAGGAAGAAVTGNSNITWIAFGTRNGAVT